MLTETVVVLKTFKLLANHSAFTPREVKALREAKAASVKRYRKLVAEVNDPILREDAQAQRVLHASIVNEAVKLERLIILEAASSLSVQEMVDQLNGMLVALESLVPLSSAIGMQIDTVADRAKSLAIEIEDLEGAGLAREFRAKLAELREVFAKVASMVKGLVAVSDELHAGKLGEILKPVLAWVTKRKKRTTSLLETLLEYDAEVGKVAGDVPMQQGFFGRMFKRSAPRPEQTNTAEQFKNAFEQIIASKAPGFAKDARSFGADLMEAPIKLVFKAFQEFDNAVANNVDLDMLASMSKQSFGSALKSFAGGFFGGGRGIGLGLPGSGVAGRI